STESTRGCGRARDLCGRVAKRRADLLDVQFDRRTTLALARLVVALAEVALRDDAHALRQRTRDVLGELAPHAGPQEQSVAVLPLARRAVERAGSRSDREVRHGNAGLRVTQLGVGGEIAYDCDNGFACHAITLGLCRRLAGRLGLSALRLGGDHRDGLF